MRVEEQYLVTTEFTIEEGTVPCGAIISVIAVNPINNNCTVYIKPYLSNGNREIDVFNINTEFIKNHASKIN